MNKWKICWYDHDTYLVHILCISDLVYRDTYGSTAGTVDIVRTLYTVARVGNEVRLGVGTNTGRQAGVTALVVTRASVRAPPTLCVGHTGQTVVVVGTLGRVVLLQELDGKHIQLSPDHRFLVGDVPLQDDCGVLLLLHLALSRHLKHVPIAPGRVGEYHAASIPTRLH